MDLLHLLNFVHRLAGLDKKLDQITAAQRETKETLMSLTETLEALRQQVASNTAAEAAEVAAEKATGTALHGLIDEVHQLAAAAQQAGTPIDPQVLLDLTAQLRDSVAPLAAATADAVAAAAAGNAVIADPNAPNPATTTGADPTGGLGAQSGPQTVSPGAATVGSAAPVVGGDGTVSQVVDNNAGGAAAFTQPPGVTTDTSH